MPTLLSPYAIHLTALAKGRRIRIVLQQGSTTKGALIIDKGEEIFSALDEILKRSKLGRTNVEDIFVTCESGASFLSCQMAEAARDTFVFARSVGLPAGRQV